MMNNVLHPYTSVGSLIKKIMAINPDLSVQEVIWLIQQATRAQGEPGHESGSTKTTIDESHALELAQATLNQRKENK